MGQPRELRGDRRRHASPVKLLTQAKTTGSLTQRLSPCVMATTSGEPARTNGANQQICSTKLQHQKHGLSRPRGSGSQLARGRQGGHIGAAHSAGLLRGKLRSTKRPASAYRSELLIITHQPNNGPPICRGRWRVARSRGRSAGPPRGRRQSLHGQQWTLARSRTLSEAFLAAVSTGPHRPFHPIMSAVGQHFR
jgi:hypothetical protein